MKAMAITWILGLCFAAAAYAQEGCPDDWIVVHEESFDDPGVFTQTDPDIYIAGGEVVWSVERDGGEQYVYRTIPGFAGLADAIRITVRGRIDSASSNCGCYAGVGPVAPQGVGRGRAVKFGYFGGGCPTRGYLISSDDAILDQAENGCVFTGTWLWIEAGVTYEATLTYCTAQASLEVTGVGTGAGVLGFDYRTLYVGLSGDGDWPECSGAFESMTVEVRGSAVAVPDAAVITAEFSRARPNPFHAGTRIPLSMPAAGDVRLRIFDAGGRSVRLLAVPSMSAGDQELSWDGLTREGSEAAPGVYYYEITTPTGTSSGQIVKIGR